jgi:polyisoprenoid-binding protein YceI
MSAKDVPGKDPANSVPGLGQANKIDSAGFSARGTFKRSDFGMKTYLGAIGDDVDLIIEIEAKKKS